MSARVSPSTNIAVESASASVPSSQMIVADSRPLLAGAPDCAAKRQALLAALSLPPHLSTKGLCEVLCTMTCAAELQTFLAQYLPEYAEEAAT